MKKLRYFIEVRAVEFLAWSMRRLPRHVTHVLAQTVGALAYLLDSRGRHTALENLRVAFPDRFSWSERQRITRKCYQNFAQTFLDLFWFANLTSENLSEHVEMEYTEPEAAQAAIDSNAIWITPHFGNFELSGLVWGYLNLKTPLTLIAQNFKNPALTDIFTAARQVSGHQVIPQQAALLRLTKALAKGGHAAFLTDLNIKPGRAAVAISCFGGLKMSATALHANLAQRLDIRIMPVVALPIPGGRYKMRVLPHIHVKAGDSLHDAAQRCWDLFEEEIRLRPELWMWMYKHWRYLPNDASDAIYPDYANPSKAFAAMCRENKKTVSA